MTIRVALEADGDDDDESFAASSESSFPPPNASHIASTSGALRPSKSAGLSPMARQRRIVTVARLRVSSGTDVDVGGSLIQAASSQSTSASSVASGDGSSEIVQSRITSSRRNSGPRPAKRARVSFSRHCSGRTATSASPSVTDTRSLRRSRRKGSRRVPTAISRRAASSRGAMAYSSRTRAAVKA
jgi:hypothetical protein